MKKPVQIFMGYTNDRKSFGNWCIRTGTGGTYAHALIMFQYDDGSRAYYESISSVDPVTGKTGVRGPIPAGRIPDWENRDSKNRSYLIQEVEGLTQEEIIEAEEFLKEAVPKITYAKLQILQNVRSLLTGRMGSAKRVSPRKWTCSETAFRCLPCRVRDYLGIGNFLYDMITPAGKFGLLEMVDRWNDKID